MFFKSAHIYLAVRLNALKPLSSHSHKAESEAALGFVRFGKVW